MKSIKASKILKLKQILIVNYISDITHGEEDKDRGNGFNIFYLQITGVTEFSRKKT